jgi:hypothetical protein
MPVPSCYRGAGVICGPSRPGESGTDPDDGATPETAARPVVGCDVPENLIDAAMDPRCGWAVRVAGTREALMHYDELRVIGSPGETASRLERAYIGWRSAMAHQRLLTWPTELIVCEELRARWKRRAIAPWTRASLLSSWQAA